MQPQIVPIVGGAIAGLLPTILTAVVAWLNNRGLQARRTQALALAQQRIAFLADWVKAQEDLSSSDQLEALKRSVSDELNTLRSELSDILDDRRRAALAETPAERAFLQKVLLTYAPRSPAAWVFHTLFYMSLGVTGILVLLTAVGSDPTTLASTIGCLDVPGLILTLVFQQLARQADKRVQLALQAHVTAAPVAAAVPSIPAAPGD